MNVAIIPARGGSKRIPGKNIKMFGGKPMIAWSIEAAIDTGIFDDIIVSTDDEMVATIARNYGASVPFIRPPELSNDHAGTIPVIKHACNYLHTTGKKYSYACCIYATAPFINASDIITGKNLISDKNLDYAFSVSAYPYPIQRALRIKSDGNVEMFKSEMFNIRSQDLEEAWHDAGQFYWGTLDAWINEKPVFSSNSAPIKIPRERSQDIDTPDDWKFAEILFEVNKKNGDIF